MTKHHYVRVYAHGPNAFWYTCAQCGGRGYTEEGYDVTYVDLAIACGGYVCEACVEEDDNAKLKGRCGCGSGKRFLECDCYEREAEDASRRRDAAEGFEG